MTPARLALSSLLHQPGRTAVSVIGTAFAVVLVFMQLGFLGAVENTATLLYGKMRFDVLVTSGEYIDLSRPGRLSRDTLARVNGVADVQPVSIGQAYWRNPTDDPVKGKQRWALTVVGIPPGEKCRLEVVAQDGASVLAGSWLAASTAETKPVTLNGSALIDPAQVQSVRVVDTAGKQYVDVTV